MTNNEPGLGEKALSKVAEVGIMSQLDEVEELNVDIRTDPLKVVQGEVDSVAIEGKGMVVKQDLRMESVTISTDSVAINPMSAVFGNIELTQPTDAQAHILLTESDLNRALASEYLHSKMQSLQVEVEGKPEIINILRARIRLPGDNKIVINGDFSIQRTGELKQIAATVVPELKENEQRISLEVLSAEGQGLTFELVSALLEQISELLDLSNFDIPGISLQLQKFDVQAGQIVLYAKSIIKQIPSA